MQRILRFLTFFVMFVVGTNAWSAGYVCTESMTYTSCSNGYYVSDCGASSNWSGRTLTESDVSLGNSCEPCPTGYTCTGGLVCPIESSAQSGYLCDDVKRYVSCPAGEYLSDCGDSSNWVGQTLNKSELVIGNACVSCPDGAVCNGGATCPVGDVEWKATVYTKSTSSFYFSIRAAGTFYVDWGDGHIEVKSTNDADEYLDWSHDYDDDQVREIKIGGLATGYSDEDSFTVISFNDNSDIDSISGSLGAIFPTLEDGTQPMFNNAFYQSRLRTISADLLTGIHGQARQDMFSYMFYATMLEEIPDGLFDGLDGIAVPNLFKGTFRETNVKEIPAGLFSGVSGAADGMFKETFRGCTGLTEIPDGLFDGVAGTETLPENMFYETFYGCSLLTGPAAKMSDGRFLHDIWPMTGYSMGTYANATGLDDWDYIPSSWGGGLIKCAAGTYLPANATTCATCPAGSYCVAESTEPMACPAGYTSGDATGLTQGADCFGGYKFTLTTTADTSYFEFMIGAAGNFWVDWGDGNVGYYPSSGTVVPNHRYASAGEYTIKLGGLATSHSTADIGFNLFPERVAAVSGSLGAIFPTLSDGSVPAFQELFQGATNLTEIPATLFSGVTGAARDYMFTNAFEGSGLTSIPDGLFDGLDQSKGLKITTFAGTFKNCASLKGPAAKMSATKGGKFLHEIWPMSEVSMNTYTGSVDLDNWVDIPLSWGGGGKTVCEPGYYLRGGDQECDICLAGLYCPGGELIPSMTDMVGIYNCPAGSYCPAGSDTPTACPSGYTSGDATGLTSEVGCFGGYKFELTTTADTDTVEFMLGAAGKFWVDWGDGEVQEIVRETVGTVVKLVSHIYASAGQRTVRIGGLATGYGSGSAVVFWKSTLNNSYTFKIASISGSLGAIFPTLSDGSVPRFSQTFYGATNMTSIPAGLFSGVSGAVDGMFRSTFEGCTGLTEIPVGLFDGVAGTETLPENMFYQTFYNNTSLTGPAAKMSADKGGKFLHEIWPMTGATWNTYTGTNIDNLAYIPTSWGGGGQAITCAGGTYLPANATTCATCPAGSYCGGLTDVATSTADQGLTTCPAGSYCVAESTEPMACPAGYTSGNATGLTQGVDCFGGYKFEIETTDDLTGEFLFTMMGVKGDFWVDWGDGEIQEIVRDVFDYQEITHTYTGDAQKRTIRFGGLATEYDTAATYYDSSVIVFQDNPYVSKLSGSLGKIFPTLSDGSQPVFFSTFYDCTGLTEIPAELFDGISGTPRETMFLNTFGGCTGLTEIPDGLFDGITGAAEGVFASTFQGCTGLSSIPDGLFDGITGAAKSMFSTTFGGCTGLSSIPDGLFDGVSGAADYMFSYTFSGCTKLSSIPDGLFDGVAGTETLPENMFYQTFYNNTSLTGPAAKMSADKGGKYLHEIWPMTGVTLETYTGATGLTDWVDIPLSWGGGGRITCAAGQYIAKGGSTCKTCKEGYYCPGGDLTPSTTADVGLTQCPADSFCVAGVSAPTTCASVNDGLYPKSNAGATAATSCYLSLAPNQYIDATTETVKTGCPAGYFCLGANVSADATPVDGMMGATSCKNFGPMYTSDANTIVPVAEETYGAENVANVKQKMADAGLDASVVKFGCYANVPAGSYKNGSWAAATLETCPAGTWSGAHRSYMSIATTDAECNACPAGYTSGDATGLTQGADCFGGYKFEIETTDDLTDEFLFTMVSVKGNFWVDWGDGEVQEIVRDVFDYQTITHTYTGDAQKRTIRFGGLATAYNTTATAWNSGVIKFQDNPYVSKLSGSLGAIFPTLADGSQPGFWLAFVNNTNLTEIPAELFDGISGQARPQMFSNTFAGCAKLTEIPVGLFDGITGAASEMFNATFGGCTSLTEIPAGLFSGVIGAAEGMFASTFQGCTNLTSIPDGLFDGVAGTETLPDGTFYQTFYGDTSLTGPAAKMSAAKGGKYLHKIWPMTGATWNTYTGATGLTDWDYIPLSWGGGGRITCAAGQYIAKGDSTCTTCKEGYYCPGGELTPSTTADVGLTQCPADSFCVAGVSAPTTCASVNDGLYPKSNAGATAATSCYLRLAPNQYIDATTETVKIGCPAGYFCSETDVRADTTPVDGMKGAVSCSAQFGPIYTSDANTVVPLAEETYGAENVANIKQRMTDAGLDASVAKFGCYANVPAGSYKNGGWGAATLETCPAGTWSGAHRSYMSIATTDAECNACPAGYTSGDATGLENAGECFGGYKFMINTTADTSEFEININPYGSFVVDWGDGSVETLLSEGGVSQSHTYATPGAYTIKIGGLATFDYFSGVMSFGSSVTNIASVDGSLGAIFPTQDGEVPRFAGMFDGAVNMTSISADLFSGITGVDDGMFEGTFRGCTALTEIPAGLFSGVSGAAYGMFYSTFEGCTKLSSIPDGLFDGVAGTETLPDYMFQRTFYNNTSLTGPAAKMSDGRFLHDIWPMTGTTWETYTGTNIDNLAYIPTSWGGGGQTITCAAGTYLPANATACETCPAGNYCAGLTGVLPSDANQGINACPAGYTSGDATGLENAGECFGGYKFELTTTAGTSSFNIYINAAGNFVIDWGDGNVEPVINENPTNKSVPHTYATAGTYTIKMGGLATEYDVEAITQDDVPVVRFSSSKIASIDGSIGAIFPTLSNGDQPGFYGTFSGSKITSLPPTLFKGIHGAGASMFGATFDGCKALTEIPAGLFSGVSGAADYMFASTFYGCTNLTSIPDGLFSGVTGAATAMFYGTFSSCEALTEIPADLFSGVDGAAQEMFSYTFHSCTGLSSIPDGLFDGVSGAADYMFNGTFVGCTGLTEIPAGLFSGVSGAADHMFSGTFSGCTNLTSIPAGLFSGVSGAADHMFSNTFYGCTGLSSIPDGLFSGVTGAARYMFYNTFSGCTGLTEIPVGLFDGVAGTETLPENMFSRTFYNNTSLTGPAAKMSADKGGKFLHEIWPMTGATWNTYTGTNIDNLAYIPTSWGGGGQTITCAAGTYLPANATACETCPAGNYCAGLTGVLPSDANQGINACPAGYTSGDATGLTSGVDCFGGYKFTLTTTANTSEFSFTVGAAGNFWVDWGDDNVQPITKTETGTEPISHTYETAGTYIIKIGGLATGYDSLVTVITFMDSATKIASIDGSLGAIFPTLSDGSMSYFGPVFNGAVNLTSIPAGLFSGVSSATFSSTFAGCTGLTSIPESLFSDLSVVGEHAFYSVFRGCSGLTSIPEKLFSGISDAVDSMFMDTFRDCTGLTNIPENLFSGISGAALMMFSYTFYNTSITSIPAGLFSGVSGAAVAMFSHTFSGTNITSIPAGLFSGVTGAAAVMFNGTFNGCTNLTSIPDGLFSGVTGAAEGMFSGTFNGCTKLASIPDGLFDGVAGTETLPGNMFYQTFYNNTSLTGPAAKMSAAKGGKYLHKIWPMTGATWETYTGTNIDNLTYIPTSWGGGGQTITCAAGTYLPANATVCATCTTTNYCEGGDALEPWPSADLGLSSCATATNNNYTLSDAGATNVNACYTNTSAGNSVETEGGAQTACPAGSYCEKPQKVQYGSVGGSEQCPAGSFCPEGSVTPTSCSTLGLYVNSEAGSDAAEDCFFTTTAGKYLAQGATALASCLPADYCPATKLNYPAVGGNVACPDAATHKRTTYPASFTEFGNFVASTPKNVSWGEGKREITQCYVEEYFTNDSGKFANYAYYNEDTQKYDTDVINEVNGVLTVRRFYTRLNPGYYVKDRYTDTYCNPKSDGSPSTNNMLFRDAVVCPAGSYCPGFTSMPKCTSGDYATTDQIGINSCATDTDSKYTLSEAGAGSKDMCYLKTDASKFVKAAAAGQVTCDKGNFCAGGTTVYYGTAGGATTGGSATCPANSFCVAGVSAPTACSTLGGGLYKNSDAGSDENTDCHFTVDGGTYIDSKDAAAVSDCTGGYYCPETKLNWPNVGTKTDCPVPADHKRTTFPASYYNPKITSTIFVASRAANIEQCKVITWMVSDTVGELYENATYNTETGLYDTTTNVGWAKVNPGYYLKTPGSCGAYAYYKEALPCEANSYCPGKDKVTCNTDNQATVHTPTFGINSCSTDTGNNYPLSAGGASATSINACYLTLAEGKSVETENAAPVSCPAGGYCTGGANVYYGSTGGFTGCGDGKYNDQTGQSAASACKEITAGCWGSSATTACPAYCAANSWSNAGAASCTACDSDYSNSGDSAAAHAGESSCKVTCAAGKVVDTAYAACTAPAGAWYSAEHVVSQGETSGENKQSCPTATQYADKVVSYSNNSHADKTKCYARFEEPLANNSGELGYLNCYLGNATDYGTSSTSNCWTYPAQLSCSGGYYSPKNANSYGEMWFINLNDALNNACVQVGAGYWSPADELTRNECPTGYVNGSATASAENQCKITVPAGNYVGSAGATYTACAKGYAKSTTETIAYGETTPVCDACVAGTYADVTGLAQCKACGENFTTSADSGATQCDIEYKFFATTTEDTSSFSVDISAAGDFYIDWGDGTTTRKKGKSSTSETMTKSYSGADARTIRLGGLATEYDVEAITQDDVPVVSFSSSKIASIDGSIGAIFPTLSNGDQPGFFATFGNSKITSLPPTLFKGIHGAGASMFIETFYGCTGLTEIPAELFSGVSGAADGMFDYTFYGCTGLTEIPAGLFSGVSGAANYMFASTFYGCTNLTSIPATLFSGVDGAADYMFNGTFDGCTSLTEIPAVLFSGVSGAADYMFSSTFSGCTNLTSIPDGLFSGVDGAANGMFSSTFEGCTNLNSIPDGLFDGITGAAYSMFNGTFSYTNITSIPADLFSGVSGAADYMFARTFNNCTNLTSIPDGLFDGVAGAETLPDYMFRWTFNGCTALTGPAAKMSAAKGGKYLHEIWPMTGSTMQTYTGTNIDGLEYIPTSWGGGGVRFVKCPGGQYLIANSTTCVACPAGSFCTGGEFEPFAETDAGVEQCAVGSYTSTTGQSACIACGSAESVVENEDGESVGTWGLTTSSVGQTSCDATCANANAVHGWTDAVWNSDNTVSNLCEINACKGDSEVGMGDGHYLDAENNKCVLCNTFADGLYPHSSRGGVTKGREACFLYTSEIPGHYIDAEDMMVATPCPLATYSAGNDEVVVHYGETSTCDTCPDDTYADEEGLAACKSCLPNYTTKGGGKKEAASACRIYCSGGSYLKTANATECVSVGSGNWAAGGYVSQGSISDTLSACPAGLTTIGYGVGADEEGDCGRILNISGEKLYLRSDKKTDLALNVLVDGVVYYGNMSTEDKFISDGVNKKLKLNLNDVIYSVYDDSAENYVGDTGADITLDPNMAATSIVPALFTDESVDVWSATLSDGSVVSGEWGCSATTSSNGAYGADGFEPEGSGVGCWCKMTEPAQGAKWVYASNHDYCTDKCSYLCANNLKGTKAKNITYRTNLYQSAGISVN